MSETATELVIRAIGRPAPMGSKKHVGGGRMVEMSKALPQWRRDVETACAVAIRARNSFVPFDGPLAISVVFLLPRPKQPMNPDWPIGPPDGSKLLRAVEDCLVRAGVVKDDARFVRSFHEKQWATGERAPGARIVVRSIEAVLV